MTDSIGLLDALAAQPEQFAAAHGLAAAAELSGVLTLNQIANIVLVGMGDAGIVGDVVHAVATSELCIPVAVHKGYGCPAFVGPRTLVFALSYSGETEETMSAASAALDAGATVVAVTSGGALRDVVVGRGGVHIPCAPSPTDRTTLMALMPAVFVVLHRIGLYAGARDALLVAEAQLAKRRDLCVDAVAGTVNPARELARKIDRTFPLIYGGGELGAAAAYRWKCAFTESAKGPAFWNAYPELDHNEIVGWGQHGDITRQLITIIELRHSDEFPRIAERFSATREIVREAVHQVLEVRAEGDGSLAQVLDLIAMGEWVSCYVALQNDVDPGPIPAIADLKRALANDER
ncbi:MAG: SIS domain-containing protein [Acidimicrobiia bacterium]